MPVLYLPDQS